MAFAHIEKHLLAIGIAPLGNEGYVPMRDEVWDQLGPNGGAYVPSVIRWLAARFGGFCFPGGVFYFDPHCQADAMIGWFFDERELLDVFEWTRETLPDDVVPISDDGGDNHLAIGVGEANAGVVYFHKHDALLGEHLDVVHPSIEDFLMSLHREA
jgi:hypothetical protein